MQDETHAFNVADALKHGIEAAIILNSMRFWIRTNRANGKHEHDGRTWMYNSVRAWRELFPYMTTQGLRTAIEKLKTAGIIQTGNYNQKAYDKTMWYSFVDEVDQIGQKPLSELTKGRESLCQNQQMDLSKSTNGFVKNDKPIPIQTNSNTNIKEPAPFSLKPGTPEYSELIAKTMLARIGESSDNLLNPDQRAAELENLKSALRGKSGNNETRIQEGAGAVEMEPQNITAYG